MFSSPDHGPSLQSQAIAGQAANAGVQYANLGVDPAVFSTRIRIRSSSMPRSDRKRPRGSVYLTGQTVDQSGFIDSSTSVSYNGRVDLVAGYNATKNILIIQLPRMHTGSKPCPSFTNPPSGATPTSAAGSTSGPITLAQIA